MLSDLIVSAGGLKGFLTTSVNLIGAIQRVMRCKSVGSEGLGTRRKKGVGTDSFSGHGKSQGRRPQLGR